MAGEDRITGQPLRTGVCHRSTPVRALNAYTRPSSAPTYTIPPETDGVFLIRPPTMAVHRVAPESASKAHSVDLSDPTKTVDPEMEKDPRAAQVAADHTLAPVALSSAYTFPSSDPTNTLPRATSGEESSTSLPVEYDQILAPVEAFRA